MLRAVLMGLLGVSSIAACSKDSTESVAKSQPGVAAGKVLEITGSVQVKHGDATKPLAAGDSVEGDDTIITGADGNVVIELAHNSARWELGPNKQQKVRESIAWKAVKATAEEVDHATAAAGRPAERNAAGTVATALEAMPAGGAAPDPAAAPGAASEADFTPKGGGAAPAEPPRVRRPARKAAPPPPPPADMEDDAADDEAPAPSRRRGAVMKKSDDGGGSLAPLGTAGGGGMGVSSGAAAGAQRTESAPAPSPAPASAPSPATQIAAKKPALHACLKGHPDPITITVAGAGGSPTVKVASKTQVSAALEECVKSVIGSLRLSGSFTTRLEIKP